jgi:hypothetical protein
MTPEELTEFIHRGPTEGLVAALAPLTESDRKKLSKTVIELRKTLPASELGVPFVHQLSPKAQRLRLALLALGPWGEAQRVRVFHVAPNWRKESLTALFQILHDRKPEWIEKWVERELDERQAMSWSFVRRLIRAGLCPRPHSDNYILKMLQSPLWVSLPDPQEKQSRKDLLLSDPDLLTWEVWRIFELSPVRQTIFWDVDVKHPASWASALVALSRECKLDRRRLVHASLGSLSRNTEARNTGWFARFHELLEPTDDERQELQPSYQQLLAHPVAAVAGLALEALARLEKVGRLDVVGFLDAVRAVFHLQTKAQPLAALRILERLCAKGAEHAPSLVETLLAAMTHADAEVQEKALDLLEEFLPSAGPAVAAQLTAQTDQLVPSVQEKARQLLRTIQPKVDQEETPSCLGPLVEEARRLPSPWREFAGIDSIVQALDEDREVRPLAFDPMRVPRLYAEHRLSPIQTLDELLERLTVAVEGLDDAIEFELLLDGLSRLCDQWPEDMPARVKPLVQRLSELATEPMGLVHATWGLGLRALLCRLVLRWCSPTFALAGVTLRPERRALLLFLQKRLDALEYRLRRQQAAPLLACPTHRQGWIEPAELGRRLAWYQASNLEPNVHDFIQGLLRLAPDNRTEALGVAADLRGPHGVAFRFALGAPLEDMSLPTPLFITASRARAPRGQLPDGQLAGSASGPDADQAARYSWQMEDPPPKAVGSEARVALSFIPDLPADDSMRDVPSVLLHTWGILDDDSWMTGARRGLHGWAATVWPAHLAPYFAAGLSIPRRGYMQADLLRQRAPFLEPLFDPDVPFTEMAQVLLALALTQKEPEVAGLAVDALIELIRDGRCLGPELGAVFARLLPAGSVKLNRFAKHLDTAARASLLHAHVCAQIVQTACADLADVPRDLHHVLGPLLQWLTALEDEVVPRCRPLLQRAKSGKTGTLAQKLLLLKRSSDQHRRVLVEALQGRVERCRRWQTASNNST